MKKWLKIALIFIVILVGLVVFDTLQAKIFDNSPLLKIRENFNDGSYYIDKGILVNHYHCSNNEKVTIWKGAKYACSFKKIIDKAEQTNNSTHIIYVRNKDGFDWDSISDNNDINKLIDLITHSKKVTETVDFEQGLVFSFYNDKNLPIEALFIDKNLKNFIVKDEQLNSTMYVIDDSYDLEKLLKDVGIKFFKIGNYSVCRGVEKFYEKGDYDYYRGCHNNVDDKIIFLMEEPMNLIEALNEGYITIDKVIEAYPNYYMAVNNIYN